MKTKEQILTDFNLDFRMKDTAFFISASKYEKHQLWREFGHNSVWIDDSDDFFYDFEPKYHMPMMLKFEFVQIYAQRIAFFYPTSPQIDWDIVYKFFHEIQVDKIIEPNSFNSCIFECQILRAEKNGFERRLKEVERLYNKYKDSTEYDEVRSTAISIANTFPELIREIRILQEKVFRREMCNGRK